MKLESEKIPSWAIGVAVVASTAIVVFVGYKVYQGIKKTVADKDLNKTLTDSKTQLNTVVSQGITPTSTDDVYDGLATSILNDLDGCKLPTTEAKVVKNILDIVKNNSDWYKLVLAFGKRDVSPCGGFGFFKSSFTLADLLHDKLVSSTSSYLAEFVTLGISTMYADTTFQVLQQGLQKVGVTI